MSYYFSHTDNPTRQRVLYGEPQHDDSHVEDRDIFCTTESCADERSLFVQCTHSLTAVDDGFTRVERGSRPVRSA
ncbi:hypothetical protein C440_09427 [Haloferax mucosum ATCC BAA-1512]|uniref:Uncharacterized protein n=1 Tax=Haloferax mucosum ATCC BAA-1512 TaxID=662479 RepID=M0IHF3_9EURY|nr:hypothetical protein [Haloferax mucosum]ELZ95288.1 hypothetical protein C440_09427 [Haloferax mucosum ATCC BAA-1512]